MSYHQVKKGLEPGTVLYTDKKKVETVVIENIIYNQNTFVETKISKISELEYDKDSDTIQWITVTGLHDVAIIEYIGNLFGIHNLVLEDILNTTQRPKVDFFDNLIFVVLKNLSFTTSKTEINHEQVSIIFGKNFVLCFVEKDKHLFFPIKERMKIASSKIRNTGSDYLAYTLMDLIVDHYFILLEKIEVHLDFYENKIINGEQSNVLNNVYKLKRENLVLNNAIWPLRELIAQLERAETDLIKKKSHIYFRDLYDHTIQVIDRTGVYRDLLTALLELHLSGSGNRTNEVMKVLTVISTIFMPLTFIAGVYGMNFKNMPELFVPWAYFAVIGLMVVIAIAMLIYFRRKKWF
jgi:magnesium transporter